jgi:NAD(P)-dependent dehydrogenase (short-subunit alcohol dehydrogenase family)
MKRFEGRVAIVTGAARGIGAATARRFAAEGANVVIVDVIDELGEAVASEIRSAGGSALYRHCDVSSLAEWQALADLTLQQFGRLDIVHNNAFTLSYAPAHAMEEAVWDRQIAVCLKAVFLSVKTCMQHLTSSGGVMINTSSVHALMSFRQHPAYDAAKGAISALTRQLAAEYGPTVRVNAVLPGGIMTHAWAKYSDEEIQGFARQTVAGRLGQPEEIAAAVLFLASDEASYITGVNLPVDGGWSIWKE